MAEDLGGENILHTWANTHTLGIAHTKKFHECAVFHDSMKQKSLLFDCQLWLGTFGNNRKSLIVSAVHYSCHNIMFNILFRHLHFLPVTFCCLYYIHIHIQSPYVFSF